MPSRPNQLTRFVRFLRGESVESSSGQAKRLLTILGLICLVVLILSPFVVLAVQTSGGGSHGARATPTHSATHPGQGTSTAAAAPGAPAKGLTDNPAYQWWRWPNHPQPDSWWGLEQNQQTLGAQVSLMQELGVKMFRVELVWAFVAPNMPGGATYDSNTARNPNWSGYQWSRWDLIVQLTAAAGIQLEPMVVYTPDWASGVTTTVNGGPNDHPLSAQYFGDFMFAAATHYKGQIHYWEMWNEPDLAAHTWSDAASNSLQTYVDLILKPGYQAVKQVDPTALVVLGGLTGSSNLPLVYAAGGRPYFDVVNFHEYSPGAGGVAAAVDHAKAAMSANGDDNKPLWLTEFGFKTQSDWDGSTDPTADSSTPGETTQSQLVSGVFALKRLQAIFLYQLHDTNVFGVGGVVDKQVHWGLVSRDFTHRKLGFDAYQAVASGGLPSLALTITHSVATPQAALAARYTSPNPFPFALTPRAC